MSFKDKLKEKRLEANLTQVQLAEKVSVTPRTIQHYELGTRKPTKLDIVEKLAKALNTTPEYLLGQNGLLVVAAHEQGGSKAARDIDELVSEVTGMFAGGRLSDEALDGAMKALNDAYWIAKEKNKKYTPKKYRISALRQQLIAVSQQSLEKIPSFFCRQIKVVFLLPHTKITSALTVSITADRRAFILPTHSI